MDDTLRHELTQLTCDLVAIESTSDRLDRVAEAVAYVEQYARRTSAARVERIDHEGVANLVVTLRDTRSPAVVLNAHLDVVPGRPGQFWPEVRDGRIYGRGTQDMKGSAAVLMRLMRDLAALPEPPDVGFQFVGDEEIGGFNGTGYLLEQGWRCDFFIAAEPTDLQICFQQKGGMWVDVTIPGQPAHGSRPWDGRNPIAALRDGLIVLERHYPTPDEAAWVTTVVPTIVSGGEASNRLPEAVQLTLDIRHVPEEQPESVLRALQDAFPTSKIALARPPGPPLDTPPDNVHVQHLQGVIRAVTEEEGKLYREHYASDARFYSDVGIAAVCFGPIGAGLHSDEEWVEIESLETTYHILRRLAEQPGQ